MCVYLRNGVLRQVERRLQQPVSHGLDHRVNHTDAKVQRPGCAAGLPEGTLQIGAERKNVLCVAERDPSGVAQLQLAHIFHASSTMRPNWGSMAEVPA